MPTQKKRINLSVSHELDTVLQTLAKRDRVAVATKTLELIRTAIELEEDATLGVLAKERDTSDAVYVSHTVAWKHLTK